VFASIILVSAPHAETAKTTHAHSAHERTKRGARTGRIGRQLRKTHSAALSLLFEFVVGLLAKLIAKAAEIWDTWHIAKQRLAGGT
jgi:hypothetical protein